MQRLGIYVRQSREKETTGSIDDQRLKGIKKASDLGIGSYEVYIDHGESAVYDTLENRPEMLRLISDIKRGAITDVYVYDESRLTRNQQTKLIIKSIFADHSIKIYTEIDGTIDFADSNQEFMSDIRTLFAVKSVRDNAIKIRSVLKNRVIDGKAHGGILKPFGYTGDENKNLVVDKKEAEIIVDIFNMHLKGLGSGSIANELNRRGVETKGRKLLKNGINVKNRYNGEIKNIANEELIWVGNTILNILKNPIYKGQRVYKGEFYTAPAIVTPAIWESVQGQIKKNKQMTGKVKHQYLLRGLCYCGRCGSTFAGRTRLSKKDHYYYCVSKLKTVKCGIRSINIDFLENLIWYRIVNNENIIPLIEKKVEEVQNPEYIRVISIKRAEIINQLGLVEKAKEKMLDLYSENLINKEDVTKKLTKNKEEINKLNFELDQINLELDDIERLRVGFDDVLEYINKIGEIERTVNFDVKRDLIRSAVEKVIIDYDDTTEVYNITVKFSYHRNLRIYHLKKGVAPVFTDYLTKMTKNGVSFPLPPSFQLSDLK